MHTLMLWLRWSWRDLRARWLQVTVIALIIALGTGVYSGLGSTTPWRLQAATQSYALLNMYDLRLQLPAGSFLDEHTLTNAIRSIEHAAWITDVEERLIAPVTVQAQTGRETVLVRGQIVGASVADNGTRVHAVHVEQGRALTLADAGKLTGILEFHFAEHYDLPTQGTIQLNGGVTLDYVGQGFAPEFFLVVTPEGGMWAQASFAAVFTSLATAQTIVDRPGKVNDAVLVLADGADRSVVLAELETVMQTLHPQTGFTLINREDDPVYDLVYDGAYMNQELYDIIALLFLAGAMLGAFNLANRIVESQRRQIGIGMALGVAPHWLAVRPVLVGVQIAVLGMVFGVVMGIGMAQISAIWISGLIPMPVQGRVFQPDIFLEGASLGLILPILATLVPVWRAVRVRPVEAIQSGHLIAKSGGLAPLASTRFIPGKSFVHMPIRNLLRAPRRTLLTVLGITAAITTLIGMVGMRDTALVNLQMIEDEAYQQHPNRQIAFLSDAYALESESLNAITAEPSVGLAVPTVRVTGQAQRGSTSFHVLIEAMDLTNPLWTPTLTQGRYPQASDMSLPEVLISKSAASDLKIGIGDMFTLQHPRRTGPFTSEIVTTNVRVTGFHRDPWRFVIVMDASESDLLGMDGLVNTLHITPAADISAAKLRGTLFAHPQIASVLAAKDSVDSIKGVMVEIVRFLSGVQIAVLILAFLIAFNSTTINLNERAREVATMLAFGLPIRTVTRMAMIENALAGAAGTLPGVAAGRAIVAWFYAERLPAIMPEMRFDVTISGSSIVLAFIIGVVVVALTPLLAMRRMTAMDIPATLRVME